MPRWPSPAIIAQGRKQHLKSGGDATHAIFSIHLADQSGGALRLYTTVSRDGVWGGGLTLVALEYSFGNLLHGGQV